VSGPPLRLGLVGCGRLAERGYLPALASIPGLTVVAVADPDPDRRAGIARALGGVVGTFATTADLLAASALDGLVVASPVAFHGADATAAAGHGLVALVEKPPAVHASDASRLLALHPAPVLAFNRRFDPGATEVRAAVQATAASDAPLELLLRLHYRRPGWGAHTVRDDALLDLGPHLVDWARWISGRDVTTVACDEITADRASLVLSLTGGATARLDAATDRPHEERIEARAGDRTIARHRIGGLVDGLVGRVRRGGRPDALVTTLRAELLAFEALLRTGDPGQLGRPADGVAVMAVIDAARRSAERGGAPVPVQIEVLP
jgi:predicted dehydrogenase